MHSAPQSRRRFLRETAATTTALAVSGLETLVAPAAAQEGAVDWFEMMPSMDVSLVFRQSELTALHRNAKEEQGVRVLKVGAEYSPLDVGLSMLGVQDVEQ